MKKLLIKDIPRPLFLMALLFSCAFFARASTVFSDLAINSAGDLITGVTAHNTPNSDHKSLLFGKINSEKSFVCLTPFPENIRPAPQKAMGGAAKGGIIIKSSFGEHLLTLDGVLTPIKGFTSLHETSLKTTPSAISGDGLWGCSLVRSSPTTGKLVLENLATGKSCVIDPRARLNYEKCPVLWGEDGLLFYEKQGFVYFARASALLKGNEVLEEYRKIGAGTISSITCSRDKLLFVDGERVYCVALGQLYSLMLYGSLVGRLPLLGRLSHSFDGERDAIYTDEALSTLLIKSDKTLVVYDPANISGEYLSIISQKTFINSQHLTVKSAIFFAAKKAYLWVLTLPFDNKPPVAFIYDVKNNFDLALTIEDTLSLYLSPSKNLCAFAAGVSLYIYDTTTWKRLNTFVNDRVKALLWLDEETIFAGGNTSYRVYTLPNNNERIIAPSSIDKARFASPTTLAVTSAKGDDFLYSIKERKWTFGKGDDNGTNGASDASDAYSAYNTDKKSDDANSAYNAQSANGENDGSSAYNANSARNVNIAYKANGGSSANGDYNIYGAYNASSANNVSIAYKANGDYNAYNAKGANNDYGFYNANNDGMANNTYNAYNEINGDRGFNFYSVNSANNTHGASSANNIRGVYNASNTNSGYNLCSIYSGNGASNDNNANGTHNASNANSAYNFYTVKSGNNTNSAYNAYIANDAGGANNGSNAYNSYGASSSGNAYSANNGSEGYNFYSANDTSSTNNTNNGYNFYNANSTNDAYKTNNTNSANGGYNGYNFYNANNSSGGNGAYGATSGNSTYNANGAYKASDAGNKEKWEVGSAPRATNPLVNKKYRVFLGEAGNELFENAIYVRSLADNKSAPLFFDAAAKSDNKKLVALVFDAYDDAEGLGEVLYTLKAYNLPATFFINGDFINRYPKETKLLSLTGNTCASMFFTSEPLVSESFVCDEDYVVRGLARCEDEYFSVTQKELALLWHAPRYLVTSSIIDWGRVAGYAYLNFSNLTMDEIAQGDERSGAMRLMDSYIAQIEKGENVVIPVTIGGQKSTALSLDLLINALTTTGAKIISATQMVK